MAAAGYTIPILSETKAYRQGLETGVIQPTSKAQDALERLLQLDDDKLERTLKAAQYATEELGTETRDVARDIERHFRDAYRAQGMSSEDATAKAKADMRELGAEGRQNLAETLSSFDGSVESFADGLMGTLGGVTSALGPGGAIAAALAALTLGVFLGDLQRAGEMSDELKAKASALGQAWIEAGDTGADAVGMLADNLAQLATETDTALPNLERLRDVANRSGSSYRTLAQAYAGNTAGLKDLWRAADARLSQLREEADAVDTTARGGAEKYSTLLKQVTAQEEYLGYLGQSLGVARDAAEAERNYAAAGGPELERKAQLVGSINEAYDAAAGAADAYVNAESGVLDVQAYIDAMNAKSQALADYQQNLATAALTPEAKGFLAEQGAEAAAQFLAGYTGASDTQKAELNRIWTEAGKANSGEYSTAVKQALPDRIDKKPKVELEADTSAADRQVSSWLARDRSLTIRARIVDQNGRLIP